MFSDPAGSSAAFTAAVRAQRHMRRVLNLLSDDSDTVRYGDVQEALVQSILANVAFTNAVKLGMHHAAPAGKHG